MKRLLLLAALAVAGAVASACDISPPAARIGDATITRSQLDAQLAQVSASTYAQCALALQGVNLPSPLTGSGDGTVTSSFASFELSTLVLERLVDNDLAARHTPVSSSDIDAARTDFVAQLTPPSATASQCGLSGAALVRRLPAAFVDEQVRFLAAQERLAVVIGHVDISPAALLAYYHAHPAQFQEVCLSDIAVTSQSVAQQIHDAIAAGSATFAVEAQKSSIDQQSAANGGQLGCVPSSEIVNSVILGAIAGLGAGQLSNPVFEAQAANGSGVWFVLRVDAKPLVSLEQAAPQIREQLLSAQNAAVSAEFTRLTRRGSVWVDPRYGSWSASQGIRPPATPTPAELLAPATAAAHSSSGLGGTSG